MTYAVNIANVASSLISDQTSNYTNTNSKLVLGHNSDMGVGALQVKNENISILTYANDPWVYGVSNFYKSRSTTPGSFAALQANDELGFFFFRGDNGSSFNTAAYIGANVDGTPGVGDMPGRLIFATTADGASTPTERMRITSTGSIGIGTGGGLTTSKLRIFNDASDLAASYSIIYGDGTHTLTANSTFSFNAVGSGPNLNQNGFNATTSLASGGNLKGVSGRAYVTGASGTVTSAVGSYSDVRNTGAGTLTNAVGFQAVITNSGGGTLTNAYGVYINALTAGTNNYGVHSNIAANTGAWNIYANGTAHNFFRGNVGIGSTTLTSVNFRVSNDITGGATSYCGYYNGSVMPTVNSAIYQQIITSTAANSAVPYTVTAVRAYSASQGTFNADSTVTTQIGFAAEGTLIGATNNYGFWSNITAGTGRWNLYVNGTADNYFAGNVGIGTTTVNAIGTTTNLAMYGSASSSISLRAAGGTGGYLASDGTNYVQLVALASTATLFLGANNTTRFAISSAGVISLGSVAGSESLRVTPVASAVNYAEIQGAATTGTPAYLASGSDTNINLYYGTKGTGVHIFATGAALGQFRITHTASAVNYLQVTGNIASGYPSLSAQGSDTNIGIFFLTKGVGTLNFGNASGIGLRIRNDLSGANYFDVFGNGAGSNPFMRSEGTDTNIAMGFTSKGAGAIYFQTNLGVSNQFVVTHTASTVNWLQATGNTTGNGPVLSAQGSDTNINLTLTPKGTGSVNVNGTLQIAGKQAANGPAFSAYANNTLQTITSSGQQKVLFQAEEFDTNNNYTNSRFTPTVEGYYQLNAEVRFDGATGTGEIMIVLYKNGSEYKRGTNQQGTQIATNFWAMTVSTLVYANGTTDYFEIYVQQTSGTSLNVTAVNNPAITWFNGCMLRGA